LSREHQELWKSYEMAGEYLLHPVYADVAAGIWYEVISIFHAITEEMRVANDLCERMERPPLFKEDYTGEKRPRKFGFLLRRTLEEFNVFVQLLDKMTSGNINFAVFKGEVSAEYMETRSDGMVVAKQKGSVNALKEWFGGLRVSRLPMPRARRQWRRSSRPSSGLRGLVRVANRH
jgi:hypothetical protein